MIISDLNPNPAGKLAIQRIGSLKNDHAACQLAEFQVETASGCKECAKLLAFSGCEKTGCFAHVSLESPCLPSHQ